MNIKTIDRLKILFSVYGVVWYLPRLKSVFGTLFRPADSTRYTEFSYLQKFLKLKNLTGMDVLDVSSPHLMAYILAKHSHVTKTNIDLSEKKFIRENKNLIFKQEDAVNLSFFDNRFDLVYSISVIEHIYSKYVQAVQEMIRVAKPGGYVYLTFPVAKEHREEWREGEVYSHQYKERGQTFFQYRFSRADVEEMLGRLPAVRVVCKDIFWEKEEGLYDSMISKIRRNIANNLVGFVKNSWTNFFYGFTLFDQNSEYSFARAKSFGNTHIILQKI